MLGFNTIMTWVSQSTNSVVAPPTFHAGDEVELFIKGRGWVIGKIERFCENPYYGQVGEMAYIGSLPGQDVWTEYIPVERLEAPRTDNACLDCDRNLRSDQLCPECGYCFSCCDCPPEFQATEETEFSELSWWERMEIIEGDRADDEYDELRTR